MEMRKFASRNKNYVNSIQSLRTIRKKGVI